MNPRNRLTYGWFRPIEPLIREHVAQASGTLRKERSLADLLEWIFLDLGWEPPTPMP